VSTNRQGGLIDSVFDLSNQQDSEFALALTEIPDADIVHFENLAHKVCGWLDEGFEGKRGFEFFRFRGQVFDRQLQAVKIERPLCGRSAAVSRVREGRVGI